MNAKRQRKLMIILLILCGLGVAALLILSALKENINLFYTPSDAKAKSLPQDAIVRLGGMVKQGSVKHEAGSLKVNFVITDFSDEINIVYEGILPNLFREGQGVVVQGKFINNHFKASTVLAKHDENYMPPNVAEALKKKNIALTESKIS